MKRTRFNGEEATVKEKICKITNGKHLPSQAVLENICFNVGPTMADCFLRAVDSTCLYDDRFYLFHVACGKCYTNTLDAVFMLENMVCGKKISQEDILSLETQTEFSAFVQKYDILKLTEQGRCTDNEGAWEMKLKIGVDNNYIDF